MSFLTLLSGPQKENIANIKHLDIFSEFFHINVIYDGIVTLIEFTIFPVSPLDASPPLF